MYVMRIHTRQISPTLKYTAVVMCNSAVLAIQINLQKNTYITHDIIIREDIRICATPDKHPCLPPHSQHTPCSLWSFLDKRSHTLPEREWEPLHTEGWMGWTLKMENGKV